jgi:purine-binding chemotaxis protein CheW
VTTVRNLRQAAVPQVQIVTFRVGGEEFGVDVFGVQEILPYREVTPVPRAPEFVEGVLDVRGSVVPIVDLRRRFEVAGCDRDEETRIILVEFGSERIGLVVDSVSEVMRVPETAISAAPEFIRGLAAEFVRGMIRLADRLVILLDLDRILSSQERIALESVDLAATPGAGGREDA